MTAISNQPVPVTPVKATPQFSPPVTKRLEKENLSPTATPQTKKSRRDDRKLSPLTVANVAQVIQPLVEQPKPFSWTQFSSLRKLVRLRTAPFKVELTQQGQELIAKVQNSPEGQLVHASNLEFFTAMLLSSVKVGNIYYRRLKNINGHFPLPQSFTVFTDPDKTTIYVSLGVAGRIGKGTASKATDIVRFVFDNQRHTICADQLHIKHLTTINQDLLHRVIARLETNELFKNRPGFAAWEHVGSYLSEAKFLDKLVIYYKKYPSSGEDLYDSYFDPNKLTLDQRNANFKTLVQKLGTPLNQMHTQGWLHRDIKAENVRYLDTEQDRNAGILADVELVYTDTDLAGRIGDQSLSGTLEYAAPELIAERTLQCADYMAKLHKFPLVKSYGKPIDIYSLGVFLHEAYLGEFPTLSIKILNFNNEDDPHLRGLAHFRARSHLSAQLGDECYLYEKREGRQLPIPSDPKELIDRCMSVIPNNRPTAAQLAQYGIQRRLFFLEPAPK